MLYFYSGTDRKKAREEMNKAVAHAARGRLQVPPQPAGGARVVRINDTNSPDDLYASLQGGGLFGESHVFVIDGVSENEEMLAVLLRMLEGMKQSDENFFVYEMSPSADTRRAIERYAEKSERFNAPKKEKDNSVFALANALRRVDKKALWAGYQRELLKGKEPEAIHGVLFWGAKDMLLKSKDGTPENKRAKKLVAELAELPHEARRNNFPLEYALERFVLSVA
ncbi:MAG: hypothetical protein AAB899_04200 [Patescibacteria group bacterium]